MKIKRALISVSDKTGLGALVRILNSLGVEILSTGGTAKAIRDEGIKVSDVSSYTGSPEMMNGRVKTLHPVIHAGLLALRDNPEHVRQMKEAGIGYIDMVVVNLYPFEKTVEKQGVTMEEAIENIDIGGPSMLRSAAKNYRSVAVVSSPDQYEDVIRFLKSGDGELPPEFLMKLAERVFARTSEYDKAISSYLREKVRDGDADKDDMPDTIDISLTKDRTLRYGENPHQRGAFYRCSAPGSGGISAIEQLQGKELSFNNIMDIGSAVNIVKDMERPTVSIIKHNNPCGAATADTIREAYIGALDCDRLSAFGSIMGFNRPIDENMSKLILEEADFIECIIAPGFDDGAIRTFSAKKNLRVLKVPSLEALSPSGRDFKKVPGGFLVQDTDTRTVSKEDLKVVTQGSPSDNLMRALLFGWYMVKYVKSNAIVICNGTKTVGIGAGQMSRVDSVIIAKRKAGERARGGILASDAFFPKSDSIEEAYKAGIAAIIQPGGSIRDQEVIDACNSYGIPMVFTGIRHFRH